MALWQSSSLDNISALMLIGLLEKIESSALEGGFSLSKAFDLLGAILFAKLEVHSHVVTARCDCLQVGHSLIQNLLLVRALALGHLDLFLLVTDLCFILGFLILQFADGALCGALVIFEFCLLGVLLFGGHTDVLLDVINDHFKNGLDAVGLAR